MRRARTWACVLSGTAASTRCTSRSASGLWPASSSCCARCSSRSTVLASETFASACSGCASSTAWNRSSALRPSGVSSRPACRAARARDRTGSACPEAAFAVACITGAAATAGAAGASGSPPTNSGTTSTSVTIPIRARYPRGMPAIGRRRPRSNGANGSLASRPARRSACRRIAACRNMPARLCRRGFVHEPVDEASADERSQQGFVGTRAGDADDDVRELLDDLLDQGIAARRDRSHVNDQHAAAAGDQQVRRLIRRAGAPHRILLANRCPR